MDRRPLKVSPRARRAARELGVDLAELAALGKSAIHEADVRALASGRDAAAHPAGSVPREEQPLAADSDPAPSHGGRLEPTGEEALVRDTAPVAVGDQPEIGEMVAAMTAPPHPPAAGGDRPAETGAVSYEEVQPALPSEQPAWEDREALTAAAAPALNEEHAAPDARIELLPSLERARPPAGAAGERDEMTETAPDDLETLLEVTAPAEELLPDDLRTPRAEAPAPGEAPPAPAGIQEREPAPVMAARQLEPTQRPDLAQAAPADELLPISPIRRVIADRARASAQEIPQFALWTEVDAGALLAAAARDPMRATAAWVRAAARALREHRRLNASWTAEGIRLRGAIHVGVTIPLEDGIVVPVLHDADRKSVEELAVELSDLVERARTRRLRGEHLTGATFTLSDWAAFGVRGGIPLVHPPHVATLGIGAPRDLPVLADGGLLFRRTVEIVLAADQRALDAAHAAAFLMALKREAEGSR